VEVFIGNKVEHEGKKKNEAPIVAFTSIIFYNRCEIHYILHLLFLLQMQYRDSTYRLHKN